MKVAWKIALYNLVFHQLPLIQHCSIFYKKKKVPKFLGIIHAGSRRGYLEKISRIEMHGWWWIRRQPISENNSGLESQKGLKINKPPFGSKQWFYTMIDTVTNMCRWWLPVNRINIHVLYFLPFLVIFRKWITMAATFAKKLDYCLWPLFYC